MLVVIAIVLAAVAYTIFAGRRARKAGEAKKEVFEKSELVVPPVFDLAVSLVSFVFFIVAIVLAFGFSPNGQVFPFLVGAVGVLLSVLSGARDVSKIRSDGPGRFDAAWQERLRVVALSIAWLLAYIWAVFVLGMVVGSGLFALVFLLVVARMRILTTVIYTAVIVGAIIALVRFAELVPPQGYLLG